MGFRTGSGVNSENPRLSKRGFPVCASTALYTLGSTQHDIRYLIGSIQNEAELEWDKQMLESERLARVYKRKQKQALTLTNLQIF